MVTNVQQTEPSGALDRALRAFAGIVVSAAKAFDVLTLDGTGRFSVVRSILFLVMHAGIAALAAGRVAFPEPWFTITWVGCAFIVLPFLVAFDFCVFLGMRRAFREEENIQSRMVPFGKRKFGRRFGDRNITAVRNGAAMTAMLVGLVVLVPVALYIADIMSDGAVFGEGEGSLATAIFGLIWPLSIPNLIAKWIVSAFWTSITVSVWFAFRDRRLRQWQKVVAYGKRADPAVSASLYDQLYMGPPDLVTKLLALALLDAESDDERDRYCELLRHFEHRLSRG